MSSWLKVAFYRSVYVINFHSVYGKLVLEAHRSLGRVVLSPKSLQSSGMVSFDYQFDISFLVKRIMRVLIVESLHEMSVAVAR